MGPVLVDVTRRMGWEGGCLLSSLSEGCSFVIDDASGRRRHIRVSIGGGHVKLSTTLNTAKPPWGLLTSWQVSPVAPSAAGLEVVFVSEDEGEDLLSIQRWVPRSLFTSPRLYFFPTSKQDAKGDPASIR